MKILIIEDDESYAKLLQNYLAGHQVKCCLTLEEGLLELDEANYDIILLDLGFSRSTPKQTLDRVFSRSPQSAVVVVTGNISAQLMEQAFDLGVHGYIIKHEITDTSLKVMIVAAHHRHKRETVYKKRLQDAAAEVTKVWQSSTVNLYKAADAVSKALVDLHSKIKGWPGS